MNRISPRKKQNRWAELYSNIMTFVNTRILVKPQEKYIFLFSEYGLPNNIEYSVFPLSATGSVSFDRAIEVAEKYAKRGYRIVLDKNPKGENLPLPKNIQRDLLYELNILAALDAIDNELDQKRFVSVEHPGWNRLEKILSKIPPQVL